MNKLQTLAYQGLFNIQTGMNDIRRKAEKNKAIKVVSLIMMALMMFGSFALAQGGDNATAREMIWGIVRVVCTIVMIVGVLFCIVGVVKFAIAHAENQGAEQQKAAMMLATGIALIILPTIIRLIKWNDIVDNAANQ